MAKQALREQMRGYYVESQPKLSLQTRFDRAADVVASSYASSKCGEDAEGFRFQDDQQFRDCIHESILASDDDELVISTLKMRACEIRTLTSMFPEKRSERGLWLTCVRRRDPLTLATGYHQVNNDTPYLAPMIGDHAWGERTVTVENVRQGASIERQIKLCEQIVHRQSPQSTSFSYYCESIGLGSL